MLYVNGSPKGSSVDISTVGDPRFYARTGPYSVAEIARAAGGSVNLSNLMLSGIAPLHAAGPDEVSFLDNRRFVGALEATRAGAVLVHPDMLGRVPATAVPIVAAATYEGWARVAAMFHPVRPSDPGIHPTTLVAASAVIDPTAEIGAFCCIEAGASIGPGCRVGPYVSVGPGVVIGRDCRVGAHVSLSHTIIGDRVCLHPGVRLGQEGFSFAHTKTGFLTIPQLGRVLVGDDVEIGANSTVDRGSVRDTVIGAGSRLDNLVQIGHNVRLGRCCVIVAQVGIAGSTELEDFVQVGGQAAMSNHLRIGRGAQIGAQAGVMADVPAGAIMLGTPAQPRNDFFRGVATLKRLSRRAKADV